MSATTISWRMLPAGRRLDARVATRVMGFLWRRVVPCGETVSARVLAAPDATIADGVWTRSDVKRNSTAAPYSLDMGAAWRVVVRMKEAHDCSLMLEQVRYDEHGAVAGEWVAHFQDVCTRGTGIGETAALAICRAALAAMEAP